MPVALLPHGSRASAGLAALIILLVLGCVTPLSQSQLPAKAERTRNLEKLEPAVLSYIQRNPAPRLPVIMQFSQEEAAGKSLLDSVPDSMASARQFHRATASIDPVGGERTCDFKHLSASAALVDGLNAIADTARNAGTCCFIFIDHPATTL
jgi:hypothetical protein